MDWNGIDLPAKYYYRDDSAILYHGDCREILPVLKDVDLMVTSPPYDNLREYNGYEWDFETTLPGLKVALKKGGVIVWVVGDATINGSETGSSYRQALGFIEAGLNLHDTMIWVKPGASNPSSNRYHQVFEFMFIISKGKPNTFNPIIDRENIWKHRFGAGTVRSANGDMNHTKTDRLKYRDVGMRNNVWYLKTASQENVCKANEHPAPFSEELAGDHIITWSNPGDLVADPMAGSGTTLRKAKDLNRKVIGIELKEEYCELTARRLSQSVMELSECTALK